MLFILYSLFVFILYTVSAIITVTCYKKSRERKSKRELVSIARWNKYLDTVINDKSLKSLKMNEINRKKLESNKNLITFFSASLEYLHSEQPDINKRFQQFIRENKDLWIKLGQSYRKKNFMLKAYFAYVCEQFCINNPKEYDDMTNVMLDYVLVPSIYCRENALKALYAFGNEYAVMEAFKRLSFNNIQHNKKLVTDGLLQFKGKKESLAKCLYYNFDQFSLEYQVAFVDYFRFTGEELKYKLKKLLMQKDLDKELVCALLRYYRKYPVKEYKDMILSWLNPPKSDDWECISSATSALGKYPGDDTLCALKSSLRSKYWYVRRNAALSISELNVSYDVVTDILEGNDRYAKEQLIYQLNYVKG